MEELVVKKDFSNIYTQDHPTPYLEEMKNLEYRIPDQTKPLYKHLAERILNYKKRPVKILDLGSSYGINSALLNHQLVMEELDDFFVTKDPHPSIKSTQNFFDELPNKDDNLEFYLVDTSSSALNFAEKAGLCENSFCVNLEKESGSSEFQQTIRDIDLFISTGCVGYIGCKSFARIFDNIYDKSPLPIFAFTVLRIFSMEDIERVFKENNFSLINTQIGPLKQRRFHDETEMNDTLDLLKNRNVDTKNLEETGYYFADFYVGGPKNIKSTWLSWVQNLENVFVPIQGN
ncbi:MAG: hypothetical protein ACE5R3_06395 [Nitrosopumilaceae archaeon]